MSQAWRKELAFLYPFPYLDRHLFDCLLMLCFEYGKILLQELCHLFFLRRARYQREQFGLQYVKSALLGTLRNLHPIYQILPKL